MKENLQNVKVGELSPTKVVVLVVFEKDGTPYRRFGVNTDLNKLLEKIEIQKSLRRQEEGKREAHQELIRSSKYQMCTDEDLEYVVFDYISDLDITTDYCKKITTEPIGLSFVIDADEEGKTSACLVPYHELLKHFTYLNDPMKSLNPDGEASYGKQFDQIVLKSRIIDEMDCYDILDYLRIDGEWHLLQNWNRKAYASEFDRTFTDKEWHDYIKFVDRWDDAYERNEAFLEMWDDEKRTYGLQY